VTLPIAINGLGRIGRALVRIAEARPELEVVAANDQAAPLVLARLLAHDTLHGPFPGRVTADDHGLSLDGRFVPLHQESDPAAIPWEAGGRSPWLVVEATGRFRSRSLAAGHLAGHLGSGARTTPSSVERVVISATASDVDATFCVGINQHDYDPRAHRVVSNASCTANCLVVTAAVLHWRFGLLHGFMNTVHCYTNSQNLVDMAHPDPRRARAAALNLIPTTTDAMEGLGLVLPELAGRIQGLAVRAPVPDGSLLDLVARVGQPVSAESVRDAYREAATSPPLAGVLAVCEEELVSSDFIGSPHSATIDLPLVATLDDDLVRVLAWYDNEWGYASRLADLIVWMGRQEGLLGSAPPTA
jgi:glyceraldehyde 3-phosphate dehydrogenase